MQKKSIMERILHKINIKTVPLLAGFRRKRLNNTDFSIISNNCWGGYAVNGSDCRRIVLQWECISLLRTI